MNFVWKQLQHRRLCDENFQYICDTSQNGFLMLHNHSLRHNGHLKGNRAKEKCLDENRKAAALDIMNAIKSNVLTK